MTKLTLHIGQPKTGTTALQERLHAQRDALRETGVLYPRLRAGLFGHSALIPRLTRDERVPGDVAFRSYWRGKGILEQSTYLWEKVLDQIAKDAPAHVVLSGEGFFSIGDVERMRALSESLSPHFETVTVAAYLRSPQQRYLSNLQQSLKMHGLTIPLRPRAYQRPLQNYLDHGPGDLQLRVFERDKLVGGDIVLDFVTQFLPEAVSVFDNLPKVEKNASLSAEAMMVLQDRANTAKTEPPFIDLPWWTRTRTIITDLDQRVAGYRRPRLTAQSDRLIQLRSSDVVWLKRRFGIVFKDVDYDIVGADNPAGPTFLQVSDICEYDPTRLAELQKLCMRELEKAHPFASISRRIASLRNFVSRMRQ